MKLRIRVSKTSQGNQDYLQVMSDDMVSVNIVLIAERIEIDDARKRNPVSLQEEIDRS